MSFLLSSFSLTECVGVQINQLCITSYSDNHKCLKLLSLTHRHSDQNVVYNNTARAMTINVITNFTQTLSVSNLLMSLFTHKKCTHNFKCFLFKCYVKILKKYMFSTLLTLYI